MRRALNAGALFYGLALAALTAVTAALLLRAGLAIPAHVPRDPDEGWNAYLAMAAMRGAPLYPHGLMTDNYPPLSFYIVGTLARLTGDAILAGRMLSLAALLGVAGGIALLLRGWKASCSAALFAAVFFAGTVAIASDYVAMDDPQMLGHAAQIAGLWLLLRRGSIAAALLMAAGLFVKHDLMAMPLAAALWLAAQDRRAALRFCLGGVCFCIGGLLAARLLLGVDLVAALASPRLWSAANLVSATAQFLVWAAGALAVLSWTAWRCRHDAAMRFVMLYLALALAFGIGFSGGDGVDANIFFDAAIALALGAGIALSRSGRAAAAWLCAAPLLFFFIRHADDIAFPFSAEAAREAAADIAFLRDRPGPALCEDLSLCYWAGKTAPVDVFNLSEAIKSGARSDDDIVRLLTVRHFRSVALTDLDALGPRAKAALRMHDRIDHEDDNGIFLTPR